MSTVRRKGKPWNPTSPIHDRRSSDLLRNAQVGIIEIDDPYEHGGKLLALRSTRNDPLARLHDRRQIDEAQYQAGRAYQKDFEIAGRGLQAVDPSKEPVDGGRHPEPLSNQQGDAVDRLNSAQRTLGAQGAALVLQVLVHGLTLEQISGIRGLKGERWRRYFAARFRECLDSLAVSYGLAMRAR